MGSLDSIHKSRKQEERQEESDRYYRERKERQEMQEAYVPGTKDSDMPWAAGDLERLRGLIEMGADVDFPSFEGTNCLTRCAARADGDCIDALLKAGADINFAVKVFSLKEYHRRKSVLKGEPNKIFEASWKILGANLPETYVTEHIGWTALDFAEQGLEDLRAASPEDLREELEWFEGLPAGTPESQRRIVERRYEDVIDLLISKGAKRGSRAATEMEA